MADIMKTDSAPDVIVNKEQQTGNVHQPQLPKRKHRRGKPKPKNGGNKPYKKTNWRFQMPQQQLNKLNSGCGGNGGGGGGGGRRRGKLLRSRSLLVPYNTNKFLMEEHMAEVPPTLLTPTGRTRDSSFSVDSDDNYFFSLPEDEEEFLTKEFANVYEKARLERLEAMTKEQLIKECLQIEDRYSKDQGTQRQQSLNVQRITLEYTTKIRALDEKVKDLARENYNLRCQLVRSATITAAAAASPPSAAAPIGAVCEPTPMESSSEDSESDSSSSTSSSSSSSSANSSCNEHHRHNDAGNYIVNNNNADDTHRDRRRSCSSLSSLDEQSNGRNSNHLAAINEVPAGSNAADDDAEERCLLLDAQMDEDELNSDHVNISKRTAE